MLMLRHATVARLAALTGATESDLRSYHQDLTASDLPEVLLQRGAHAPFTREFPQGAELYLIVRALRPARVVETGVRPGYSTTWILAALQANHFGELVSLGPGSAQGRTRGLSEYPVGQLVPPSLRSQWTLVLGNTEDRLEGILDAAPVDLFFYDNGTDSARARFELRSAWSALSPRGILMAHRVDASPAWGEFCRGQGLAPQILDAGPPPLGALAMQR
jgi:predicted O-methyltransferase YrrM